MGYKQLTLFDMQELYHAEVVRRIAKIIKAIEQPEQVKKRKYIETIRISIPLTSM